MKHIDLAEHILRATRATGPARKNGRWTTEVLGWIPFQFGLKIKKLIVLNDLSEVKWRKATIEITCVCWSNLTLDINGGKLRQKRRLSEDAT